MIKRKKEDDLLPVFDLTDTELKFFGYQLLLTETEIKLIEQLKMSKPEYKDLDIGQIAKIVFDNMIKNLELEFKKHKSKMK